MANPRGYYYRFPCPECGAAQKVLPAQVGTEIRCTECPAVILVPPAAEMTASHKPEPGTTSRPGKTSQRRENGKPAPSAKEPKNAPPARDLNVARGKLVSFACTVCQTMMRASEEELGHVIMCPHCFSPVTVGGESHKKPTPTVDLPSLVLEDSGDDNDDYQLADDAFERPRTNFVSAPTAPSPQPAEDEDEYRLGDVEERPRPAAAFPQSLTDEDRPSNNKAPPSASKKPERKFSSPSPPLEDPWSVPEPQTRPSLEERLAAAQAEQGGDGELPDYPFVSGVFGFLLYPGTRVRWLGLALGTAVVYFSTANAIAAGIEGGSTMFHSLLFGILAAASFLIVGMLESVTALAIVNDTAAGNDEVVSWPDFVFLDWAGQAFYIINAVAFSALPGFLVASFLETSGPERWLTTAACAGLSGALLFPIILLSQLDGSSPFSLLTPGVLKSLPAAPAAWLACYVMQGLVLGAAVGGCAAAIAGLGANSIGAALAVGTLSAAAVLLCSRLIGRLAWYVEEEEVVIERPTEDSTTEDVGGDLD